MEIESRNLVVTELQTRDSSQPQGWSITPIGSDVKYIRNSRASKNNNLEEDMILGIDKITTIETGTDSSGYDAVIKTIEYRNGEKDSDYYFLKSYIYDGNIGGGNVSINYDATSGDLQFELLDSNYNTFASRSNIILKEDGLHFKNKGKYYVNASGLHQNGYDEEMYQDNANNRIVINPLYTTREDNLFYQGASNTNPIPISTKTTIEYSKNGKHYIRESIVKANNE